MSIQNNTSRTSHLLSSTSRFMQKPLVFCFNTGEQSPEKKIKLAVKDLERRIIQMHKTNHIEGDVKKTILNFINHNRENTLFIDFLKDNLLEYSLLNPRRMLQTNMVFSCGTPEAKKFITDNPKEWCQLNSNQMLQTNMVFSRGTPEVKKFITDNPKEWCQLNQEQMFQTNVVFTEGTSEVKKLITDNPKGWCQLDSNQMLRTNMVFSQGTPEAKKFITDNPKEWYQLDSSQMLQTEMLFTNGTPEVKKFITDNPKEWHQFNSVNMALTNKFLIEGTSEVEKFITDNPKGWFHLSQNQMLRTNVIFSHGTPEVKKFITDNPKEWCQLDQDQMFATNKGLSRGTSELKRIIYQYKKEWFSMPAGKMNSAYESFQSFNHLEAYKAFVPEKFSNNFNTEDLNNSYTQYFNQNGIASGNQFDHVINDLIPASKIAKEIGLTDTQTYIYPLALETVNSLKAQRDVKTSFAKEAPISQEKINCYLQNKKDHISSLLDIIPRNQLKPLFASGLDVMVDRLTLSDNINMNRRFSWQDVDRILKTQSQRE